MGGYAGRGGRSGELREGAGVVAPRLHLLPSSSPERLWARLGEQRRVWQDGNQLLPSQSNHGWVAPLGCAHGWEGEPVDCGNDRDRARLGEGTQGGDRSNVEEGLVSSERPASSELCRQSRKRDDRRWRLASLGPASSFSSRSLSLSHSLSLSRASVATDASRACGGATHNFGSLPKFAAIAFVSRAAAASASHAAVVDHYRPISTVNISKIKEN